jgi:glucose/arabinose dehydrogenase
MTTRTRTRLVVCLYVAVSLLVASAPVCAAVLPEGLKIEKVLDNSVELGDIVQSPANELWLLEKTGTVRVFVAGVEQTSLAVAVSTSCESGLLDVAFAPDYGWSGQAFIYYVHSSGNARVDELFKDGTELQLGANILNLGSTPGGCRPGGGLDVGADGKLYVSVGDLETSANGQNDGVLPGKVLRAELDGSVPADNASGTLVWAKGFRNGTDLDIGDNGLVYMTDTGSGNTVDDEVNAVRESDNHGWDLVSGDSGGVYDDPVVSVLPATGIVALSMFEGNTLGVDHQDTLLYTYEDSGELHQAHLTGADLDQLDHADVFYDATADDDGTPDAGCPTQFNALAEGGEGWLYAANSGANSGIWRIWRDEPGPREVSAPGSPLPMTMGKAGALLSMSWEDLGPLDSGVPTNDCGQHPEAFMIWEGDLASVSSYAHVQLASVAGTAVSGRRTADFAPGTGDKYYLISAQNENLEGTTGAASDGTQRGGEYDYCDDKGYAHYPNGSCAPLWEHPTTGAELRLKDLNPASATHDQMINNSDFRGKVIRMDLSALACPNCRIQAPIVAGVEAGHHARDFVTITVLNNLITGVPPIPPANCVTEVATWASSYGIKGPVVCDSDLNSDGHGDVAWQYYRDFDQGCGGLPQNYYIDQGHTIYDYFCGKEVSDTLIYGKISGELNPDTCE